MLRRLAALHPRTIDLSLGRIERLLAALDHPERRLPPTIHVAGTNAKGSVVAYLRAMFEAAGKRVHVYTSPHLVRFHERIRIGGRLISERELEACLTDCERANAAAPITFFEITTAAAFLAFARHPADVTLLEVGLGGRLDATNVVAKPRVTVITPVSLDHQHFLGDSLAAIAGEKAGILKRGVPCVLGPQHPIAARVIAGAAAAVGAPLLRFGHDFEGTRAGDGALAYHDAAGVAAFPAPALPGAHQYANAATAVAAARAFGRGAPDDGAIAQGLTSVAWPARLQRLGSGSLTRGLSARGFEVWLDGGHNPHAARALSRELAAWKADGRPVYLVTGMIESKDPKGFLAALAPHLRAAWCVPVPGEHAAIPAGALAATARGVGIAARTAERLEQALAGVAARRPGRVLIAGSLYLAGAVLKAEGRAAWPR